MARQVLPVNFQDDVLNASMNGKRRYMLLQQDDGSYILNDVTNYDTEGSTFGAAQINATNQAVNQSVDKDDVLNTSEEVEANSDEKKVTGALVTKQLISDLGGLTFGQTAEGEWGYKPEGADSVIPFSNAVDLGDISASSQSSAGSRDSTFDLSAYIGYSDISANDIIFMPIEWSNTAMQDANLAALQTPAVKNYDNTTGIVTLQGMSGINYTWGATITKAHFVILK